ncbi:MAG: EscU/YscU/HrcU family type III secretion system export apparatus switch protein [Hyphomicrobium sp.]
MSGSEDKESKTEEPTDNKMRQAIEKGNVPVSRELATFGPLIGALIVLTMLSAGTVPLAGFLSGFISSPGEWQLATGAEAADLLIRTVLQASFLVLPCVAVMAFSGIISSLVQNQPRLVLDRIQPKVSRISLSAGWSRLFGGRAFVEFGKVIVKLGLIGAISASYLSVAKNDWLNALYIEPVGVPALILRSCVGLLSIFIATSAALVVFDWLWVHFNWKRDLRMTRQEVKDEMKQQDGDPIIKARLRSLARDRARRRMMAKVPQATLVIANPTHFAVALRYVRSEGGAPIVLAKGKDLIALRIREIAEKNGIPVVEDKPLARSLYSSVEVDKMIPAEFYRAVAQIILYLSSRGKIRQS